ncbi:hypothetical protein L207DRAFT_466175 [Hyaloscypha variabilis F]|uniref:Zn(2)-C6 fungal-type domain-containing protein n=1 Tax=Hyaloscypha variabilis (strain UAMH 11265 / GT02V1 / F) TaxID=1149755 RepID=A0A2J6R9C1_HYAVF|nr:hypothetical protein L207DRAFT_466175 [Hyaloscypha variabilis F]
MLRTPETPATDSPSSTKACQNCSRAKAKCAPQDDGIDPRCSRCFRLKKECVFPPRVKRKRRSPNASTNAALEQKIESLVNLLSAAQGISSTTDEPTPPESQPQSEASPVSSYRQPDATPAKEDDLSWSGVNKSCRSAWQQEAVKFNPGIPNVAGPPQCVGSISSLLHDGRSDFRNQSQLHDSRKLLNVYQEQFAPHFPFIQIPDGISVDELRSQKPWLCRTILMVAAQEERLVQQELGKQIVSEMASAILLRGEKSLDMLQSLCICNLWAYYFTSIIPVNQSTAIFQLALAILFDLGLNRPVRNDFGPGEVLADFMKASVDRKQEMKRSVDERRALLSIYLFGSVSMLCIKRHEGLQYSPYIEYTCQVLEESAECDSDLILVSLVRMQYIVESAYKGLPLKSSADDIKAPVWMHVKAARSELQKHLDSLRPEIQQHQLIQLNFYDSNVFLYGISLQEALFPETAPNQRLDLFYACLISCQTLLNKFVQMPVSEYFGFSLMDLSHVGHSCSTLLKLSLVKEAGWDLAHVRQTVNAEYYFKQIALKFIQAGNAIDQIQNRVCSESFPTGCGRAIMRVKAWYEAKISAEAVQDPLVPQDEAGIPGVGDNMNMDQMMLDDADWLEFVMGNGNYWP